MSDNPADDGQFVPKEKRTPIMLAGMCANGSHDECAHTPMTCECDCHHDLVIEAADEVGMSTMGLVTSKDWAIFTRAVDARRLTVSKSTVTELAAKSMGLMSTETAPDLGKREPEREVQAGFGGLLDQTPPAGREKTLQCPECERRMTSLQGLKLHLLKVHSVTGTIAEGVWAATPDEDRPWLVCEDCEKKFMWGSALGRHECPARLRFEFIPEDEPGGVAAPDPEPEPEPERTPSDDPFLSQGSTLHEGGFVLVREQPPNALREIFKELSQLKNATWADCENAGELVKFALAVKHGVRVSKK